MRWIDRCLGSVRRSSVPMDGFIVDNGSSDGTQVHIKEAFPEMTLIESGENLGFGKANNIGMRHALDHRYDFVYLLNQDAWVMEDTLQKMLQAHSEELSKGNNFGILSPTQYQVDGKTLDRYFARRFLVVPKVSPVTPLPYIMAAHWLISADCLRKTGLFSPVFQHNGEDENYCDRAIYHGFKIGVVTGAAAVHDRAARKDSVSTKVRRNYYMKTISEMSRITKRRSAVRNVIEIIFYGFAYSVRYLSLLPLEKMPTLLHEMPEIAITRKKSLEEGAFIGKSPKTGNR